MKKFKITKELILKYNMKNEFPEAFKKELEVGKWYKRISFNNSIVYCKEIVHDGFKGYGFLSGNWEDNYYAQSIYSEIQEATQQEVETALINEANRRGYKEGEMLCIHWDKLDITHKNVKGYFRYVDGVLFINEYVIFDKHGWATIIDETLNNPVLSLNDLLSVWGDESEIEFYKTSPLFKSFEKLAKSKIV